MRANSRKTIFENEMIALITYVGQGMWAFCQSVGKAWVRFKITEDQKEEYLRGLQSLEGVRVDCEEDRIVVFYRRRICSLRRYCEEPAYINIYTSHNWFHLPVAIGAADKLLDEASLMENITVEEG